jgi:bifunctional DNase/RNase
MQCQECDQPATLHITEARQMKAVGERHLCEAHVNRYLQEPPAGAEHPAGIAAGPAAEVRIDLVRLIINEVNDGQQVLFLQEVAGQRGFPIVIGIFEATNLDCRLKELSTPRPLTHDAWADTIGALGGRVQDVLIHDLRETTFFAWTRIVQGDCVVAVDMRPSDGLALAVLLRVPVLVAGQVLEEVCGPPG